MHSNCIHVSTDWPYQMGYGISNGFPSACCAEEGYNYRCVEIGCDATNIFNGFQEIQYFNSLQSFANGNNGKLMPCPKTNVIVFVLICRFIWRIIKTRTERRNGKESFNKDQHNYSKTNQLIPLESTHADTVTEIFCVWRRPWKETRETKLCENCIKLNMFIIEWKRNQPENKI